VYTIVLVRWVIYVGFLTQTGVETFFIGFDDGLLLNRGFLAMEWRLRVVAFYPTLESVLEFWQWFAA
jgi:hypothetical protein